jgi:hypothetical protein
MMTRLTIFGERTEHQVFVDGSTLALRDGTLTACEWFARERLTYHNVTRFAHTDVSAALRAECPRPL